MDYNLEKYIYNFDNFEKKLVYDFKVGNGGIGDCIKCFVYLLQLCIKLNIRFYYLVNDIPIEKYLKLKYAKMYIKLEHIEPVDYIKQDIWGENDLINIESNIYNIISPYKTHCVFPCNIDAINRNITIPCQDLFYFSDEVIVNSGKMLPTNISKYISIHLRMGDKFLEKDPNFNLCPFDIRQYNESNIFKTIEQHNDKTILFFCDNNDVKFSIKEKHDNIVVTNSEVAHTGHFNTTDKQVLDTITEFYLLTNSEKIIMASYSGFSMVASKFKNIPFEPIY